MDKGKLKFQFYALMLGTLALPLAFQACSGGTESLKPLDVASLAAPPITVNLKIENYCPGADRRFSQFFVVNESSRVEKNALVSDWDRDGLSNVNDNNSDFDIDFRASDTNSDGYSDLVMFVTGIRSEAQSGLRQCADPGADSDADGLNDCEERLLKTKDHYFDSDGDLIPDKVEMRFGTNPLDGMDADQDIDNDGLSNYDEIRAGLPISSSHNEQTELYRIRYQSEQVDGCFTLNVENVPIVPVSNGNSIRMYFIEQADPESETSSDVPLSYFAMRDYVTTVERSVLDKTTIELDYATLQEAMGK